MAANSPELRLASGYPDRMIILEPDLSAETARFLATDALYLARQTMPRVTGATAKRLAEVSGPGWFGIYFPDSHTWFMEQGTKAFTMRSLAGKTIPMWVTDADGSLRHKNPKMRTRTTEDGRVQVQIFRKATNPGSPGRIDNRRRQPKQPFSDASSRPGAIGKGNVGVKWRHPGVRAMSFLNAALTMAAFDAGIVADRIYVLDNAGFANLMSRRT